MDCRGGGGESRTKKRVEAITSWTDEVRRIGAHIAQKKKVYGAVVVSLERLRLCAKGGMQECSSEQAKTSADDYREEKEADILPVARVPPSASLIHAVYHVTSSDRSSSSAAHRSASARIHAAHTRGKPSKVSAEAEGPETNSDVTAIPQQKEQLVRVLEEARLLRATLPANRLRSLKPEAPASRTPLEPRDRGVGVMAKSFQVPDANGVLNAGEREADAGSIDALDRILQQAREIAPLNNLTEAPADRAKASDRVKAAANQRQSTQGKSKDAPGAARTGRGGLTAATPAAAGMQQASFIGIL